MNILAVGDSFTAGCELADHILVPQHPGYFGPGQKRSEQLEATLQEWNKKFRLPVIDKQYSSSEVLSETQRLEKSFTYPNLLAKKLGCEVLNFAESGNSMWGITKSLYDYSLFNDVSNTIVFYQPTSIGRISQFDGRGHRTFLFSNFENYDTITQEMKTLLKLKIAMENDESLLIEWFKEYLSCVQLLENLNFKKFYIVEVGFYSLIQDTAVKIKKLTNYLFLNEKKYKQYYANLGHETFLLNDIGINETHCVGQHYAPIVHERFADRLYAELQEQNL